MTACQRHRIQLHRPPGYLAVAALLLAVTACAAPRPHVSPLVEGGSAACSGQRQIEVQNPLRDEVTVWVRTMDERRLRLNPTLRPQETRSYTIAGSVAIKEVYGLAAASMVSESHMSRRGAMQVDVSPVLSCGGFPAPDAPAASPGGPAAHR